MSIKKYLIGALVSTILYSESKTSNLCDEWESVEIGSYTIEACYKRGNGMFHVPIYMIVDRDTGKIRTEYDLNKNFISDELEYRCLNNLNKLEKIYWQSSEEDKKEIEIVAKGIRDACKSGFLVDMFMRILILEEIMEERKRR